LSPLAKRVYNIPIEKKEQLKSNKDINRSEFSLSGFHLVVWWIHRSQYSNLNLHFAVNTTPPPPSRGVVLLLGGPKHPQVLHHKSLAYGL